MCLVSRDGEPVTLLFLIAAPNTKDNVHLDVLSKLSVLMMDENFSDSLRNASSVEEFLSIIDKADAEQAGIDERLTAGSGEEAADRNGENAAQSGGQEIQAQKAGAETEKTVGPKILAVTSCPTGIAHTYMAAEGLEKAARAKGWKIKVETRGSAGAKTVWKTTVCVRFPHRFFLPGGLWKTARGKIPDWRKANP